MNDFCINLSYMANLRILCFLFLFVLSFTIYSQGNQEKVAAVKEMIINDNTIRALSQNSTDSIVFESRDSTSVFCYSDYVESFWYKMYVNTDCDFTFLIKPSSIDNIYNFFLYQYEGNISLVELLNKQIPAVRANLCKEPMMDGTGLSATSSVSYNDPKSKSKQKDFYSTPCHAKLPLKKGSVLFLNVYHIKGQDCGFELLLNTNTCTQKVKSIYRLCYSDLMPTAKTKKCLNVSPLNGSVPILKNNNQPLALSKITNSSNPSSKLVFSKVIFSIKDSLRHSLMDADILWIKKRKGIKSNNHIEEKGKIEMVIEPQMQYQVIFSSVGYKNRSLFFSTGDTLVNLKMEIIMEPYKQGDNFVMDKIYFIPNSTKMKQAAVSDELDKLYSFLKTNQGIQIEIQGHTNGNKRIKSSYEGDFVGSSKKLSQLRAEVIKKYLTDKGISSERLLAVGYGGEKMIFQNPKTQEQANRNIRVEVMILSDKGAMLSSKINKQ